MFMFLISKGAETLEGENIGSGRIDPAAGTGVPRAQTELETAMLDACREQEEWPAQIAAGINAGIDFVIARPEAAQTLIMRPGEGPERWRYERIIGRLAGFLRVNAPPRPPLPLLTDEALVGGLVGLVGDHIRVDRLDRLSQLRSELVLFTLLPYLGFEEAQRWTTLTSRGP
jgi:hypothetical protein